MPLLVGPRRRGDGVDGGEVSWVVDRVEVTVFSDIIVIIILTVVLSLKL